MGDPDPLFQPPRPLVPPLFARGSPCFLAYLAQQAEGDLWVLMHQAWRGPRADTSVFTLASLFFILVASLCDLTGGLAWTTWKLQATNDQGQSIDLAEDDLVDEILVTPARVCSYHTKDDNTYCASDFEKTLECHIPDVSDSSAKVKGCKCLRGYKTVRGVFIAGLAFTLLAMTLTTPQYGLLRIETSEWTRTLSVVCACAHCLAIFLPFLLNLIAACVAFASCGGWTRYCNAGRCARFDISASTGLILYATGVVFQLIALLASLLPLAPLWSAMRPPPPPMGTEVRQNVYVTTAMASSPHPGTPPMVPPPPIQAIVDPASGHTYYLNTVTRQTSWEVPDLREASSPRSPTRGSSLGFTQSVSAQM